MAESDVLAQLRDIQLPKAIGWWPLAPGWYVLVVLGLVVFFMLIYSLYRRYLNGLAKREALNLLLHYKQEYQRGRESRFVAADISELLRRVALAYYPREQVAYLQGDAWINFLNGTSKGINFNRVRPSLLQLPYQVEAQANLKPLFIHARAWIRQRGKPCSS